MVRRVQWGGDYDGMRMAGVRGEDCAYKDGEKSMSEGGGTSTIKKRRVQWGTNNFREATTRRRALWPVVVSPGYKRHC